ncbi:MAG: hypothetical protein ABJA83_15415 [Burkholderiaceae bacterium]
MKGDDRALDLRLEFHNVDAALLVAAVDVILLRLARRDDPVAVDAALDVLVQAKH